MKVNTLEGQELLDFCRMVANGSMVESIQDEFEMPVAVVKENTKAVAAKADAYGGLDGFIEYLEGKHEQPAAISTVKQTHNRTHEGLRDRLFEAMDALRDGKIESGDAKVLATLAKEICNSQRTEIEIIRRRAENAKLIGQSVA